MAGPFAQAQLLEESQCSAASLPRRTSGEEGGEFDVLLGGELVEEMGCLETSPMSRRRSCAKSTLGELIDPTFPEEHLP